MTNTNQPDEEASLIQQQVEPETATEGYLEWQKRNLMEAEAKHRIRIRNMKDKFRFVKIY